MTEISATPESLSAASSPRPYAPSWFDRFTNWVDRLPLPAPLFYAGLALVVGVAQVLIQSNNNGGSLHAFPVLHVLTPIYYLALMHYLDRVAADALERMRPLLSVSEAEYDDLLYRLTTLPSRPMWIAALLGALYGFSALFWIPLEMQVNDLGFVNTPASLVFNYALMPFIYGVIGVMLYHAIHQLQVVREIYDRATRIDLFKLRPLYAFSSISGLTGVGIVVFSYLWFLFSPALLVFNTAFVIIFTSIALLTFLLPLRGAHRLLVQEKERLIGENGDRQRIALAEVHRRVDNGEMSEMDDLHKTITALELERTLLERISTWPWKPETPRAVIAALLFPVVVWLLQWVLERILA